MKTIFFFITFFLCAGTIMGETISATDPRIKYLGAWMTDNNTRYTVYGGSQFRIRFQGTLTLNMRATDGYLKIRPLGSDSDRIYNIEPATLSSIDMTEYQIDYMAQPGRFFFPSSYGYYSARLILESVTLTPGSHLYEATPPYSDMKLEFLGDSITMAHRILGGSGNYPETMDATKSFAYLAAKKLNTPYRVRGYGGESVRDLGGKVPWFLYETPLEPEPEPDFVFINIGANNTSMAPSDFEKHYRNLLNAVSEFFPRSSVFLLNFFNHKGRDRRDSLKKVLSQMPGRAEFLDCEPWLTGYTDGIHPDIGAHAELADALAEFLEPVPVPADYNGNGKTDPGFFLGPRSGRWRIAMNTNDSPEELYFGWSETVPVPGDYDGDGKTDIAVFSPQDGMWHIFQSSAGYKAQQFGWSETVPVPGDYNGDGKTDIAVFWPEAGMWYILTSSGEFIVRQFGWSETVPVPGDYNGDGKTDIAVFLQRAGIWYILTSSGEFIMRRFGWHETTPHPGDYDGDGIDDIAIYHPCSGMWYMYQSSEGFNYTQFGGNSAKPVPADYDGDGKTDIAVLYHNRYWHIMQSTEGYAVRFFR